MAEFEDIVSRVGDEELRRQLMEAYARATKGRKFGLVYEDHLAEGSPLYGLAIKRGMRVATRAPDGGALFVVEDVRDGVASCVPAGNFSRGERVEHGEGVQFPLSELVAVSTFGEPIYPYLEKLDEIEHGGGDLWHTLIQADNYHALQLLEYLYAGQVDCIYIDPPYNTGAKDWKYNNDYVDGTDAWRHSKWLSMMEKRLALAKRLLNPKDSVLIVTIDEKEYLHLGMLLEQMFPEARIQMVSSVINPAGAGRDYEFSRTDEYVYFVQLGASRVIPEKAKVENTPVIWDSLRRSSLANARGMHGKGACGPNQFYPFYVNVETGRIVKIGDPIPEGQDRNSAPQIEGCVAVFPVRPNGKEMNWGIKPEEATARLEKGYLRAGKYKPEEPQQFAISYITGGNIEDIESGKAIVTGREADGSVIAYYPQGRSKMPTTNWVNGEHDAQQYGSKLIREIIGSRFPYPKSLYAVHDAIRFFVANKPQALILDFFAGSGTTLHAVNLLNAEDGGKRRCILVTNNEVSADEAKAMTKKGLKPGDAEWERLGIAQYVTWPRTTCSIRGVNVKGEALKGEYIPSKRPMAEGFQANAAFFRLGFLNPTAVALGRRLKELLPTLWMKAGAVGRCPSEVEGGRLELEGGSDAGRSYRVWPENRFALLMDEAKFAAFKAAVRETKTIETIYLVTDSEQSYQAMARAFAGRKTYQLYRNYLETFRVNAARR